MPRRRTALVILLLWTLAAADLFRRDVLPELVVGPPPDFRAIAAAEADHPTYWTILAPGERGEEPGDRTVGRVVTRTERSRDGWTRLASRAVLDSSELLRGTPYAALEATRIEIHASCEIDSSGNLDSFRVTVREGMNLRSDLLIIDGHLRNDQLVVTARSPIPVLRFSHSFPYRPHSLVQTSLGPIGWLPGLHVGQRWESRVVSPLTGRVETATVEVVGRRHITWDQNPIPVHEVVSRTSGSMGTFTARTWVRGDGLVIRQEVPFPLVKLVLERVPEAQATGAESLELP
jgi:hypothetical protein